MKAVEEMSLWSFKMKKYLITLPIILFVPQVALAHCPLCTAGAGALAILAASLGVSSTVVGVLIGAFALALSLWISKTVKNQYVPYQEHILVIVIFLSTVIPIMPFIKHYAPFYVPFIGRYGTTFTINLYILGVIIGLFTMLMTPKISRMLTKICQKQVPFQGLAITITLLILVSIITQLLS